MNKLIAEILTMFAMKFIRKAQKGPEYIKPSKPGRLERRLKEQLRKAGWIPMVLIVLFIGCTHARVVYVPPGKAVQLRQDIKNVDVWVRDEDGKRWPGTLKKAHEGWYLLPLEGTENDE